MSMTDQWLSLRRFTQARIALGRVGHALPTKALLDFQLAHAQARDAVHLPWDIESFAEQVRDNGAEALILETPVADRGDYLRRPDLGRILTEESRSRLRDLDVATPDLALIVTNGLSSTAVRLHGIGLLQEMLAGLRQRHYSIAPVCLVANGRVALLDDIGSALAAQMAIIIVGERPGLSSPDSLGIYLTYAPQPGNNDAQRNCISNIRPPEGLSYQGAAAKLLHLVGEAMARRISGVALKDGTVRTIE
jgi:ethanolamine ammonia-lyase small subunit